MKPYYLLVAFICIATISTSVGIDVDKLREQLKKILHEKDIPPQVAKGIAMLEDSIEILRCVPTIRQGNCYKSTPCKLPKLKFDKVVSIVLTICKNPYKIIIDFLPIDMPWYAKINFKPVVINLNNDEKNGVFTIHSDTTMKAHVKHTHFHTAKVRFYIDGAIRYDCTKPKGNDLASKMQRAVTNLGAGAGKWSRVYYHMHIRIELKVKHVHWGRFDYKCKKCEDLINKSGFIGSAGPAQCNEEVAWYLRYENGIHERYRKVFQGRFLGEVFCTRVCLKEKKVPASRCTNGNFYYKLHLTGPRPGPVCTFH